MVCTPTHPDPSRPAERVAILRWTAGLGAVTAESLAERHGIAVASARAHLGGAERHGLLARCRPLAAGRPCIPPPAMDCGSPAPAAWSRAG
jgi:hypothetical protein